MGGTNREDPEAPAMPSIPQVHLSRATQTLVYIVFSLTQTPLSCRVNIAQPMGMLFGSLQGTLLSTEHLFQTNVPAHGIPRQMFPHMGSPDVPPHGISRQMFLPMGSLGMMTHPSKLDQSGNSTFIYKNAWHLVSASWYWQRHQSKAFLL